MNEKLIRIDQNDNVAVACRDLLTGETAEISGLHITMRSDIPVGHKVALRTIPQGETVLKYGSPIGHADCNIQVGEWVHSHNLKTNLSDIIQYEFHGDFRQQQRQTDDTFEGYVRADGSVGTRNEIWIIPTVSCVNRTTEKLAEAARREFNGLCDGIFAFPHNAGCSQMGG